MRVSAYASRFLPCFIVLSHSEDVNVGKGAVECLCCFMKCCPLRVDQHKVHYTCIKNIHNFLFR